MEPAIRENSGRNEDGTFKPGVSGNPSGRPKGTMKDYLRRKFMELSDEEKEAWLKENKVPGIDQFKMAEGNPHQGVEVSGKDGGPIELINGMRIVKEHGTGVQNKEPETT